MVGGCLNRTARQRISMLRSDDLISWHIRGATRHSDDGFNRRADRQ